RRAIQGGEDLPEGPAGVGSDAQLNRVNLPYLLRVNVDLDQPGRWDGKSMLGPPRAAVGLGETGAHRQDDVGFPDRLVGHARTPDPGHTKGQGMIFRESSFAHEGSRHRDLEPLRQLE